MEKLKKITVSGFKSIRDLDIELNDLTLLVGANGSGKSNFVSLFSMLSHTLSESLQLYVGRNGGASALLHYGARQTPQMRFALRFSDQETTSEYGIQLAFASPDRLLFTDEHLQFRQRGQEDDFQRDLGVGQLEPKLIELSRNGGDPVAREVATLFVTRFRELQVYHFHDTTPDSSIRVTQDIGRNRYLMSNGGNLAAFLYMLQEQWPAHFQRIVSAIRTIVPYIKDFILEPDRLNSSSILLRWRDNSPQYEFGAHHLSDGSLRAIALVTALLQPDELMPAVMIIDEPELGLHPSAVALIASLIKSVACRRQIIVATQSPRLLAEFSPEDVVVVEREEDDRGYGHSVFHRLSKPELGDWLENYDLGALFEMQVTGGGPQ